jgi:hypothetical protein
MAPQTQRVCQCRLVIVALRIRANSRYDYRTESARSRWVRKSCWHLRAARRNSANSHRRIGLNSGSLSIAGYEQSALLIAFVNCRRPASVCPQKLKFSALWYSNSPSREKKGSASNFAAASPNSFGDELPTQVRRNSNHQGMPSSAKCHLSHSEVPAARTLRRLQPANSCGTQFLPAPGVRWISTPARIRCISGSSCRLSNRRFPAMPTTSSSC